MTVTESAPRSSLPTAKLPSGGGRWVGRGGGGGCFNGGKQRL